MKNAATYLAIVFSFFVIACDKENVKLDSNNLIGKWKMTASYADIGNGKGTWKAISDKEAGRYVEFKSDGTLAGNVFPAYVNYITTDKKILVFTTKDQQKQNYAFELADGRLTMSPAEPITCIEGCGTRFEKVK